MSTVEGDLDMEYYLWYSLFYINFVFDVVLSIIEIYFLSSNECYILDYYDIKNFLYANFILAIALKVLILSLSNLEISGLHTYKRGGPFLLPILCNFF